MWIRLKSETELLKESVERLNYQVQFSEAINDIQNDIFSHGMYNEDTGKIMAWLKKKLNAVCPSPDKLKEFFSGLGKKMDAKVQGCKNDSIKNAWNALKGMVAATDIPDDQGGEEGDEGSDGEVEQQQENPEGGEGEQTGGEEGAEGGETEEEMAAESLFEESMYEEGFWDSIKSGWNKLTGQQAPAKGRGKRKTTGKKTATKKGTPKKGIVKKTAAKKGTPKKGGKKRKSAGKKEIQDWKSKVWAFIKGHWKQIVVILIACLALYFVGGWIAGMFLKSGTAVAATKAVTSGASKFRLPGGMTKLPPGAKLIGNGVVKFANGGVLAAPDADIDMDF